LFNINLSNLLGASPVFVIKYRTFGTIDKLSSLRLAGRTPREWICNSFISELSVPEPPIHTSVDEIHANPQLNWPWLVGHGYWHFSDIDLDNFRFS